MGQYMDISLPLSHNMPCWPGDEPFSHWPTSSIGKDGSVCNVSSFKMSTHFGTHMDSSFHFYDDGLKITDIKPDLLCGPCQVIEVFSTTGYIEKEHIDYILKPGTERLLVKTQNSKLLFKEKFCPDYTGFSLDCIGYILERGIRLLGLDYYSIGRYNEGEIIHKAYFKNRSNVALEGIYLADVLPGSYEMFCLPLKIEDSGGSPARVVLKNI